VYDKSTGDAVHNYEIKKGNSRYHSSQRIKDKIIEAKTGVPTELIRRP